MASVDLTWTNNDDSPDGGIDIERSTDGGSTWDDLITGLSVSTESYTDTTILAEGTYDYRIERNTDHTSATSSSVDIFVSVVTQIGTLQMDKDGTVSDIPLYSLDSYSETWLRADDGNGNTGALHITDAIGEPLRARDPTDGTVVGIETVKSISIETLGFNEGGTTESGYDAIGFQENGDSLTNVDTLGVT